MSRPWMPLYIDNYLVETADLTPAEHGCYILLLILAWRRSDGAIPNDMKYVRHAISCPEMHGNEFNRLAPRLLKRFFELGEDGKFRNKRLTIELENANKISEKQREKAGKRWGNHEETVGKWLGNGREMVGKRESDTKPVNDLADAAAMPIHNSTVHNKERKMPADARADAPADLEKQFFDRAVEILYGPPNDARKVAGQLRKACGNDIAKARSSLELSAGKSHPKSWIMGHISWLKKKSAEPSDDTVLMNNADDRYVIQ